MFDRRLVVGVPVDVVSERDVLACVREWVDRRSPQQIATVNAEFVVRAERDPHFRRLLAATALNTPDGAGVVWAMRRQGAAVAERVGGSDLIWSICGQAARSGHRVFLLGGQPGVAEKTAERLQSTYPNLEVAGTHAGSPEPEEQAYIVHLIRQTRADIVLVAFGAPQQEWWISRNLAASGASVGLGVGGSFDYVAGTARRAPVWMREHGLEWMWRLMREPWRWRRMLALPVFVWLVLRGDSRQEIEETGDI